LNPLVIERPAIMKRTLCLRSLVVCAVCLVFFLVVLEGCKSATGPRGGNVDDRAIVARIRSLISEDPALNAAAVRVFVQEGKVTLSGPVPDGGTKARLLSEVRRADGVKSVSDNLELPH
jgi:hypothetical protein